MSNLIGFDPGQEPTSLVSDKPAKIKWPYPKVSTLDMRAFLRLFDIPSPSLIHNGKKRRKR